MMLNPTLSKLAAGSSSRLSVLFSAGLITFAVNTANSQTSWNSTVSPTWSTAANWTAGSPASPVQLAIYPGTATLQHALDLAGGAGRVSSGQQFDFVAGGVGYKFYGPAGCGAGGFSP